MCEGGGAGVCVYILGVMILMSLVVSDIMIYSLIRKQEYFYHSFRGSWGDAKRRWSSLDDDDDVYMCVCVRGSVGQGCVYTYWELY